MAKKAAAKPVAATQEQAPVSEQVSKAEAVRRTIKDGVVKPIEAVAYIKEKFGIDMSAAMFSSYKSSEAKKAGGGTAGPVGRPGRPAGRPALHARPVAANGSGPAEAAEAVKLLVDQYGPDEVKKLADLFGG